MTRRLAALAIALTLAGCQSPAARHFREGQTYAFARQPQRALEAYERTLSELGKDESPAARALRVKALRAAGDVCYLDLRDMKRALDFYRTLTDGFPDAPESFQARAN